MTASNDIMVRCEGLTKIYDEIVALENLNLEIPRGHVFGYIGHNGAGKTTTIRILAGLLTATRGKATIAGVNVGSARDRIKSLVGYMPDSFGVYDQMRVWEYLDFFGAAFKIPRKKRRERLDYVLDIADAEYMRDRFVDTLSKGMKQRVGIARTLMHDPEVMLLDEPANGLDPQARIHMRHLLRKLADSGKTLLVSSHILPELAAVCDSIGIIHQGHLRTFGPLQKVLNEIQRDRLMELRVVGAAGAAAELLRSRTGCAEVDEADESNNIVRFRFAGSDEQLHDLLKALLAAGTPVVTLREVPLSLEDAYMAISGIGAETTDESSDSGNGSDKG
ncbi:MAG TPA: ABC transporter ATP-binding protein [Phycisphaerales bacterium]|nr:ABC transporter ATP-binding protein [Phycisphaerales bacterium]